MALGVLFFYQCTLFNNFDVIENIIWSNTFAILLFVNQNCVTQLYLTKVHIQVLALMFIFNNNSRQNRKIGVIRTLHLYYI